MGATDVGDELFADGVSTGFGEYLLTEAVVMMRIFEANTFLRDTTHLSEARYKTVVRR